MRFRKGGAEWAVGMPREIGPGWICNMIISRLWMAREDMPGSQREDILFIMISMTAASKSYPGTIWT